MANVPGQVGNHWSEIIAANTPNYMKGWEDLTMRDRLLLAALKKRGRIVYGQSGTQLEKAVKYNESDLNPYADNATIDYTRINRSKRYGFTWSGYNKTGKVTEFEQLVNRGDTAIKKYATEMIDTLMGEIKNQWPAEFFKDGYAAGNENRILGFESAFGSSTTVVADLIAKPSDNYGTHSTAVSQDSTVWTTGLTTKPNANIATDWPDGQGSTAYDWNSPKLFNWANSSMGTSSALWSVNCEKAMRRALAFATRTSGKDGRPHMALMTTTMLSEFKDLLSGRMHIYPNQVTEATELGFPDTLMFEGMMIQADFDVPASTCYLLNLEQISIDCMYDKLFGSKGGTYDPFTDSFLYKVGFWGQVTFYPKYMAKLYPYAAS